MPPLSAPFSAGGGSAKDPAAPAPQPKPGHVAIDIIPSAGTHGGAPAAASPQPPHVVVHIIPKDAAAAAAGGCSTTRRGAGHPTPTPGVSPLVRALVRGLWVAYMLLAVPALVVLQAVTRATGAPFLNAMMFFAGVFTAALFGVWLADQWARAKAEGQLAVLPLQDSA